jgi:hypothetical protein
MTQLNAAPAVGAGIGMLAMLAFVPAAIVFTYSAVKSHGARRIKSALLALGFFVFTLAGPLHDVAKTSNQFVIADVLTIISMLILGAGILYRLEEQLDSSPAPRLVPASSNTV